MFNSASYFNKPLFRWNVSKVKNMVSMFSGCMEFNEPLNTWDVSSLTNADHMFFECREFDQPLDTWNVSHVKNMAYMFCCCDKFNRPLNMWDVSNVRNMEGMFSECTLFDQPLDRWDVSKVKRMHFMFAFCANFNHPLQMWNVQNVRIIHRIFDDCPIAAANKPKFNRSVILEFAQTLPYQNTNPIAPAALPDNLLDEQQIQHVIKAEIRDAVTMDEYKNLKDYFKTTDKEDPLAFIFNGSIYVTSKEDLETICLDKSFVKYICKRVSTGIAVTKQMIEPEPYITGRSFGCLCGLIPMSNMKQIIENDENDDEKVFVIHPSKTKRAPSTASLQMLLPNPNAVGASHCQAGQEEQVNDVYVFDFEKYQKRKSSSSAPSSAPSSAKSSAKSSAQSSAKSSAKSSAQSSATRGGKTQKARQIIPKRMMKKTRKNIRRN